MPVPSVVVFDLGKVLLDFDYGIAAGKIARRSRFTPAQVRDLLDHSPLLHRFETGLMTRQQFYGEVCAACGFSGKLDEFCAAFADIFSEIKPMTALHAALRAERRADLHFLQHQRHCRRPYPRAISLLLPFRRLRSFLPAWRDETGGEDL